MNEVHPGSTGVLERNQQTNTSGGSNTETVNDNWDAELTDLVAENADVLVKPSWMDVELPLGAAMHHVPITRENVGMLAAEVRQLLLFNHKVETEEPAQGAAPEEELAKAESYVAAEESGKVESVDQKIITKPELKKESVETDAVIDQPQPQEEATQTKQPEISVTAAEKTYEPENISPPAAANYGAVNIVHSQSKQPSVAAAKTEAAPSYSSPAVGQPSKTKTVETKAQPVASATSANSASEIIPTKIDYKPAPVSITTKQVKEPKPAIKIETQAEDNKFETVERPKISKVTTHDLDLDPDLDDSLTPEEINLRK